MSRNHAWAGLLAIMLCIAVPIHAQHEREIRQHAFRNAWQVQLGLGELPWRGSFKADIAMGYHIDDRLYVGAMYQIPDRIRRDHGSFNARGIGLEGMTESRERVGQRMLLHVRYTPAPRTPFVSLGMVYNDTDTETTRFDARDRIIGGTRHTGAITVIQQRARGARPAVGAGYQQAWRNGISMSAEWIGAILGSAPEPRIHLQSEGHLAMSEVQSLSSRIREAFIASPFNRYHVFHVGAGYSFPHRL